MKYLLVSLWAFCLIGFCLPESQPHVSVVVPSVEIETQAVWQTLQDMPFFEANGYQVSLPKGPLIDELKAKSKEGTLNETDFGRLQTFMKKEGYQPAQYSKGLQQVQAQLPLLNELVAQLTSTKWEWPFQLYNHYKVVLTLYGPGGSYDPENGSIQLFTYPEGGFKQYRNPANTIIHEIVHLGIESSIIQKYQVPHGAKEGIVDQFVLLSFGEQLPTYQSQKMGDPLLDQQMKSKASLLQLEQIVAEFMEAENNK